MYARLGVVPYNELLYARETRSGPVHRVTLRTRDSEWPRTSSYSTYARLGVVPYIELLYVRALASCPVPRVTLRTGAWE